MPRLLMIDSGAFSVWTKGATVDLSAYIQFCNDFPDVHYYVNLDVIPGNAKDKTQALSKLDVEQSCQDGWKNFRRMRKEIPTPDKVIPVFHQRDDMRWLRKYLDAGTPYMGIATRLTLTLSQRMQWLNSLRPLLFDGAGRPIVKTHGFALTSWDIMKLWKWHSVDSSTWQHASVWGAVYIPRLRGGEFDYNRAPMRVHLSPMSPTKQRRNEHFENMTPSNKERILEYLSHCNVKLGSYKLIPVKEDYKLNREAEEIWYKKGKIVLHPIEVGASTSQYERYRVNAYFMKQANKVLDIDHIYFAGVPVRAPLEYRLGRRLLSYAILGDTKRGREILSTHIESMRRKKHVG